MYVDRLKKTTHKRGDTFSRLVIVEDNSGPVDLTGLTVTSEVRRVSDNLLVATLATDATGAATGRVIITAGSTSAWPITISDTPLVCDVKFVGLGTSRTETFAIEVVPEVTA